MDHIQKRKDTNIKIAATIFAFMLLVLLYGLMSNSSQKKAEYLRVQNEASLANCLNAAQPNYSHDDLTTIALYQPASYQAIIQAQQNAEAACRSEYPTN